jgi:HAE1 family hydrophobic/amphiphilic exporter-1
MLASKLIRNENFGKKNKTLDAVGTGYRHVLSWALDHRKIILLVTFLAFSGSLIALPRIGTEFMPATDQGQITISVRMPRGTRFAETAAVVAQVEAVAAAIPETAAVSASIGDSQMRIGASPSRDRGSVTLVLKSLGVRNRSTEEIGDELRERLRIPGAEIRVDTGGMMFGGGGGGMSSAPIAIDIQGENIEVLKSIAAHVLETVASVPGTREAALNYEEGAPELRILPDRQRAAQFGLNTAQISAAVQTALQGTVASRYKVDGRELDIRVMVPNRSQKTIQDIESMMLASPLGTLVPLYAVADFEYASGPVQINRTDQARVLTVTSAIRGRALGSVVQDIQNRMADYPLPEGYTLFYGGENQQLMETFGDLILAMILGVVLVYMVMAAQFESLVHPFVIMAAVPLGFTGALAGLLLAGVSLSVPAVLGMIVLAGIVVNNGIVLVDYMNILRREGGASRRESILQAGTIRLRPILMTTMTTVLALVPLALGIGEGAELQLPLAVSIIGGLTLSTLLTLVVIPVLYTLTDDFGAWVRGWIQRHGGGGV